MFNSIKKNNFEKAMAAISTGSEILYEFNQKYFDEDFENGVVTKPSKYTERVRIYKAKKGAITLKWKKQDARYEIQYSTHKNMKNAVSKKFKTATSTTLKHLSRKKYYYVRIRTYKIVNGKYIYSAYSSIRKIRTK